MSHAKTNYMISILEISGTMSTERNNVQPIMYLLAYLLSFLIVFNEQFTKKYFFRNFNVLKYVLHLKSQ